MKRFKQTLIGTELDVRASDANAVVRYLVELDVNSDGSPATTVCVRTPDNLSLALSQIPVTIGSTSDFPNTIQGAPVAISDADAALSADGQFVAQFQTHQLRATRQRAYTGDTNNANKVYVDNYYASKQKPIIEFGYTAVQQQTQTYLPAGATSDDPTNRVQMVLNWTALAGTYQQAGKNADGTTIPQWPQTDLHFLKTPASGSMFRFGSSIRISSMWYNDELATQDIPLLASLFTAVTNSTPTPWSKANGLLVADDSQNWLVTGMPSVTTDGGWTNRLTFEMVFSPYGWDSYAVYTDPLTGQAAIISKAVLAQLYQPGTFDAGGSVPSSFIVDGAGVGRFVQQRSIDLTDIIGFVSQGLLAPQVDFGIFTEQAAGS